MLEDLFDMHVPGWLLAIIASYLSDRKMTLKFNQSWSEPRSMPASFSQGCFLAMILFIIQFNGAALRPAIPHPMINTEEEMKQRRLSVKYIDDNSIAATYNLKIDIEDDCGKKQLPLTYNQRTRHKVLPQHHIIQHEADSFLEFTQENQFVINERKCEVMTFNFSKKYAFPPDINLGNSDIIKEVTHSKILGLLVQNNLKWDMNTEHIYKRAASKLWLLRRLKKFNLEWEILTDFYTKEIRVLLEYAVPAWYNAITREQSNVIEKIQRYATSIILDNWSSLSYKVRCTLLSIEPLFIRRKTIALNFHCGHLSTQDIPTCL